MRWGVAHLSLLDTHANTHTHIYVDVYLYVYMVCRYVMHLISELDFTFLISVSCVPFDCVFLVIYEKFTFLSCGVVVF